MRRAIALLIQNPHLASHITEPLPDNPVPGQLFLNQLVEIIQKKPNITTGALIEYWRGQKEENFIAKLAQLEYITPDSGVEKEFIGAIGQLTLLGFDNEINRLMAKAAQEALTEEEKLELAGWINRKKGCTINAQ